MRSSHLHPNPDRIKFVWYATVEHQSRLPAIAAMIGHCPDDWHYLCESRSTCLIYGYFHGFTPGRAHPLEPIAPCCLPQSVDYATFGVMFLVVFFRRPIGCLLAGFFSIVILMGRNHKQCGKSRFAVQASKRSDNLHHWPWLFVSIVSKTLDFVCDLWNVTYMACVFIH